MRPIKAQLTASNEVADHPIELLFDSRSNTDWRANGNRPSAMVTFSEKVDLLSIYVYSGTRRRRLRQPPPPRDAPVHVPATGRRRPVTARGHPRQAVLRAQGVGSRQGHDQGAHDDRPGRRAGRDLRDRVLQEGRRIGPGSCELTQAQARPAAAAVEPPDAEPLEDRRVLAPVAARRARVAGSVARLDEHPPQRVLVAVDLEAEAARPDRRRVVARQHRLRRELARRLDRRLAVVIAARDDPLRRALPRAAARRRTARAPARYAAAASSPRARAARPSATARSKRPTSTASGADVEPVGVALAGDERAPDRRRDLVQPAPQRRQRDVEAAGAGGGVGLGPQRVLDHLAMDRRARRARRAAAAGSGRAAWRRRAGPGGRRRRARTRRACGSGRPARGRPAARRSRW